MSEEEAIRICQFLGISQTVFLDQFTELPETQNHTEKFQLKSQPGGECIFYQNQKCKIYPVRPAQCKTFPFWKELLKSHYRWKTAATWCEGMNQGTLYSKEEIENILKRNAD